MIKNLDLNLMKALVDSDFFLLLKKSKSTNTSDIKFLNVQQLIKNIKQLVRMLQFIKKSNKNSLIIQTQNRHTLFLINTFFENYPTKFNVRPQQSFSYGKSLASTDSKMLFILDSSSSGNLENFFIRQFLNNNLLIQGIANLKSSKTNFGDYKIINDSIDLKKLIFILVLFTEVLKYK